MRSTMFEGRPAASRGEGKQMKWEFLIAIRDEDDLPSGHKRKKEGDVIAFKPHPWEWGEKEVRGYFIVIVDGLTREEAADLASPVDDGTMKRRFAIPFEIIKKGWCPRISMAHVRNSRMRHQPVKDDGIVMDAREKVAIFFDKKRQSFKYRKRRTA